MNFIGARCKVSAEGIGQSRWIQSNHNYKSSGARDFHFGLGKATNADVTGILASGKPISGAVAKSRLIVFHDLSPKSKYQLVLENAERSAFTEHALPADTERRNPNHHRSMLAVTTAFWDAYLNNNEQALQWLDSDAVRSVLDKDDQWQKK